MRECVHQMVVIFLLFAFFPTFVIIHRYYSALIEPPKLDLFPLSSLTTTEESHLFSPLERHFRPSKGSKLGPRWKKGPFTLASFNQNNTKPVRRRRRRRLRNVEKLVEKVVFPVFFFFFPFLLLFQTCPNLFCTYEVIAFLCCSGLILSSRCSRLRKGVDCLVFVRFTAKLFAVW